MDISLPRKPKTFRPVLVICHPGHELRLFGWMTQTRPIVQVMTDGSGSRRQPRLKSTEHVLHATGAAPGRMFGRFADKQLYQRLLGRDVAFFVDVLEELTESFIALDALLVVADAAEGHNPGHDVCRLLVDAALMLVRQRTGRCLTNRAVALSAAPGSTMAAERIELPVDLWKRKLEAARKYAGLAEEVERAFAAYGPDAFAVESLLPVPSPLSLPGDSPYYEEYGRRQVEAGHYPALIRYADHVAPLATELRRYVAGEERWAV